MYIRATFEVFHRRRHGFTNYIIIIVDCWWIDDDRHPGILIFDIYQVHKQRVNNIRSHWNKTIICISKACNRVVENRHSNIIGSKISIGLGNLPGDEQRWISSSTPFVTQHKCVRKSSAISFGILNYSFRSIEKRPTFPDNWISKEICWCVSNMCWTDTYMGTKPINSLWFPQYVVKRPKSISW